MRKILSLMFLVSGCVTSIKDVNVGDKLFFTDQDYLECYVEVGNILSVEVTNIGFMSKDEPEICGIITCPFKTENPPDPNLGYCINFAQLSDKQLEKGTKK